MVYNFCFVFMVVFGMNCQIIFFGLIFIFGIDSIEMELEGFFVDEEGLNQEVIIGFICNFKIFLLFSNFVFIDKEVFFFLYFINLVMFEMWNNGFVKELEWFFVNVMQLIQQEVMNYDDEEVINFGVFWFFNVYEMLFFVFFVEDWYEV